MGLIHYFVLLALSTTSALALPAPPDSEVSKRALHPCSVDVQRWCHVGPGICSEPFDVSYYPAYPTSSFHWTVPFWWAQTSTEFNTPTVGSELVPIQAGSNVLHITNVADASAAFPYGKLSFVWGTQHWDDFSPGNPCNHAAAYTLGDSAIHISCNYQCDK